MRTRPQRRFTPALLRLDQVTTEPIHWLWPGRIALGKLTLIAGNGGLGKSTVTLDVAARVTQGAPWPDAPAKRREGGGVVLLSAEDGLADTIVPRLAAAGADLSRITALRAMAGDGDTDGGPAGERGFNLRTDVEQLEEAVASTPDCRLVVIDPVTAYLGDADDHRNAEVRALLAPLTDLAARRHLAVVAVTHLNKRHNLAIHRIVGSIAWAAAARTALAFAHDPRDPQRRLVLTVKSNIAREAAGLAYRVVSSPANPNVAAIQWEPEPVSISVEAALCGEADDEPGDDIELQRAAAWLSAALGPGPAPSRQLLADGRENGINERTLRRALTKIGGRTHKLGADGGWEWRLPEHDRPVNIDELIAQHKAWEAKYYVRGLDEPLEA